MLATTSHARLGGFSTAVCVSSAARSNSLPVAAHPGLRYAAGLAKPRIGRVRQIGEGRAENLQP
jgi:hypothetical protein